MRGTARRIQEEVSESVVGRMASPGSNPNFQPRFLQLSQGATASVRMRSTAFEQLSKRMIDEIERNSHFRNAKIPSESVLELADERDDFVLQMNDYEV